MKTQTSIDNVPKSLTLGVKEKIEFYKGFKLTSNVVHCSLGGSYWLITILDQNDDEIASFQDDAHCVAKQEALQHIDEVFSHA